MKKEYQGGGAVNRVICSENYAQILDFTSGKGVMETKSPEERMEEETGGVEIDTRPQVIERSVGF